MKEPTPMRWYTGPVKLTKLPFADHWQCPVSGCDGHMNWTGDMWPTAKVGYHHVCDHCGIGLAIHEKRYPKVTFGEET